MKIKKTIILELILTLTAAIGTFGCSSESTAIYDKVMSGESGDSIEILEADKTNEVLSGELVISSVFSFDVWSSIAESFMKQYPEVSVIIDQPSEGEQNIEAFLQRYRTQFISGECGDIIDTSYFDMKKYGEDQGLFENLYSFMNSDSDFYFEDYFSCLFGALETDGKLYSIVRGVQPFYIKLNKELLSRAGIEYTKETISFWELAEIYEQVQSVVEEPVYLADYGSYDPFVEYELTYYVENNAFDTEEYEKYLELNHGMYYTAESRSRRVMTDNEIDPNTICCAVCILPQYINVFNTLYEETDKLTQAIFYEGIHGEKFMNINSSVSISSFSENKELAWEFLKFAIGNGDFGYNDYVGIPVYKEKAQRLCKDADETTTERLFRDIEKCGTIPFYNAELSASIKPVLDDYYLNDIISAEECCVQLKDKVYLYNSE